MRHQSLFVIFAILLVGSGIGLAQNASVNEKQANPNPPEIHQSAAKNDVLVLKQLLDSGQSPIAADPYNGWRPLHYTAKANAVDSAKLLIERGAGINIGSGPESVTPLQLAAVEGNCEMIQLLIENKANLNLSGFGGYTPLQNAIRNHHIDAARLLLAAGAGVAIKSRTGASTWAVYQASTESVAKLAYQKARNQVPQPELIGASTCSRCQGTGRPSQQDIQDAANQSMYSGIGSGRSTKGPAVKCSKCGGSGVIRPQQDVQAMEQYNYKVKTLAGQILDQDKTLQDLSDTLTAFGANPSVNIQTDKNWQSYRENILATYDYKTWTRAAGVEKTSLEQLLIEYADAAIAADVQAANAKAALARHKALSANGEADKAEIAHQEFKAELEKLKELAAKANEYAATIQKAMAADSPDRLKVADALQKVRTAPNVDSKIKERLRQEIESGAAIKAKQR